MPLTNRSIIACLPRTERGMPLVLGGDPKGRTFLYPNGHSIVIRNIEDPRISDIYTEHSVDTTVAKYSPSGFYIASADVSGKVRIWDTTQKEHILKNEYIPFVGNVKDLAWSSDNQRIVVVGEGRERFGHVFMAETGTSVGEIAGHSNLINSCDMRPKRPFRIITGSEDCSVGIYEGPPFKFKTTLTDHNRFVQSVRFAPDGDTFASGGFDGKMFLYKCQDYSTIGEFGSPAHAGGVYSLSFSPDGTKLISASGDKTCKIWCTSTLNLIQTHQMGATIMDQQVSSLWQGEYILSVSLSGFINYLDINDSSKPLRIVKGHNKSITGLCVKEKSQIYTASHDAAIMYWDLESGNSDRVSGVGHKNQVDGFSDNKTNEYTYTCSIDDTVKAINSTHEYVDHVMKFDSQPRGIVSEKTGLVLVACLNEISVVKDFEKIGSFPIPFEATSIAAHPSESDVAVGGRDQKVHIFLFNEPASFSPKICLEHRGTITDLAFSPNGKYLAASDSNRKVVLYNALTYELTHKQDWCFHTARVNCLSFSPNSLFLASGALDTNVIIWDILEPTKHTTMKQAHPQSQITRIGFLDASTIVTTGQDGNIKIWDI